MWQRRGPYGMVIVHSNGWLTLISLALAAGLAFVVMSALLALLAMLVMPALLLGGAWLLWKGGGAVLSSGAGERPATKRQLREARGLLEMAATADPLERYLLAVREFERLSAATLALAPESAGNRRSVRRAADLAVQARNLSGAVGELERSLLLDGRGDGARAHIWELALATRELAAYGESYAAVRRAPSLSVLRTLLAGRATLAARRGALVDRLDSARMTPAVGGAFS